MEVLSPMPARTTTAAGAAPAKETSRTSSRQPSGRSRAQSRTRASASSPRFQTFSEAIGARPTEFTKPGDENKTMRSFNLPVGVVERIRGTLKMIQARTYGLDGAENVPQSLPELLADAIAAMCTYYEDQYNNGMAAPRIRQLRRGPSPRGAIEGAAKRTGARSARST
jgi:hypothetical protein